MPSMTLQSGTARPRLPLVARRRHVLEVRTPRALQQIPRSGRQIAQLPGRTRKQSLRQRGVALANHGIRGEITVGHGGPDPHTPRGLLLDRVKRELAHINEQLGTCHTEPHVIDQIRTAREELRIVRTVDQCNRTVRVSGALVGERNHGVCSSIAATMFA